MIKLIVRFKFYFTLPFLHFLSQLLQAIMLSLSFIWERFSIIVILQLISMHASVCHTFPLSDILKRPHAFLILLEKLIGVMVRILFDEAVILNRWDKLLHMIISDLSYIVINWQKSPHTESVFQIFLLLKALYHRVNQLIKL